MKKSISAGIVGVGQFGKHFIKSFQDHPDVSRVALCDLDPKKLSERAAEFGIDETYASLDEICASNCDAIAIFTQPWLHTPQAIQVMESGKHVLSAVPIITSETADGDEILEWCDKLIDAVTKTGQYYMMAETTFFRSPTVFCRRKASEGAFGEIVLFEAEYLHDTFLPSCNLIKVNMNRRNATWDQIIERGGGAPMHYPTHSTSAPISVMGAHMTEVSCLGYVYPDDEYFRKDSVSGNVLSNETAIFRMSNGAIARINEFRRTGHTEHEGITRVLGTEASFTFGRQGGRWITKEDDEEVDVNECRDPLPEELAADLGGHGGSHAYLVHEFVDACACGRLPAVNAWEAARYVAAGVAAHESALQGGALVKVRDWGDAPE